MNKKKNIQLLVPLILLILGLYLMPIKIFQSDFSKIPGDFGDARFNNYILEHGYKYMTGKVDKYWDAPFMYPYPNVIAFSDNLLGTVPVYSAFRLLGSDRETSLQYWLLTMFALNFICCFWVVNKWTGNPILAGMGAYIFAFSIFNLGHIYNVQNFPRFIVPFVFYWAWKYLSQKEIKYFLCMMLGIVFQFYCGIYLGFFLIYSLLCLFVAYLAVYRDLQLLTQFKNLKKTGYHIGILVLAALLFIPLMGPYIEISKKFGMRNFQDIIATIPTLRSYFFTTKAPVMWQSLSEHGTKLPLWWCHFLWMGALPWIGVGLIPIILLWKKPQRGNKQFLAFLSLGLFLNFIFCLNINGFTLYKFIFGLPGFSSMRSINRVINTEVMFFVLVFAFVFNELIKGSRVIRYALTGLPLLIVIDNLIDPNEVMRFSKSDSQQQVELLKNKIQHQYDKKYAGIAYMADDITKDPIRININTMLAAQDLNIPCVNAYSGATPGEYIDFGYNANEASLLKWLKYNNTDTGLVQNINDFDIKEKSRMSVHLKTTSGKYFCDDKDFNHFIVANRDNGYLWETFTLVLFENHKCAVRTYTGSFLSAETTENGQVIANRNVINNRETFTITYLADGYIAFKADNGKYISIDKNTARLFANAETIGDSEKFKLIPVE